MSECVCTSKCEEDCKYGHVYEVDRAHVYLHCDAMDKDYIYGKKIDCEFKEKK